MNESPLFQIGKKVLLTTDGWFVAPDGVEYRGIHGTVKSIRNADQSLGVATNPNSTNWYVEIGNMLVAGCQIHYAVRSDTCNFGDAVTSGHHEGVAWRGLRPTRIYNADGEG